MFQYDQFTGYIIIPSNIPMKIQKIFGCTAKPQQSENKIKNKCVLEEGNYK